MSDARILVVEDDDDVALAVVTVLGRAGFGVDRAADGRDGLRRFHDGRPDLVVLDVGLPELDGWQVLERLRDLSDVPVLMLTARGLEAEKVRGLRAGADDYLTKPFGNAELVARVEALLRRHRPADRTDGDTYRDDHLTIDRRAREVRVGDEAVRLTPLEYRLLDELVRHPAQVLDTDQLLERVWHDPTGVGPERVKVVVMRLRKKVAGAGFDPVETVRGFGYRYTGR